jgi:hypothetical protein
MNKSNKLLAMAIVGIFVSGPAQAENMKAGADTAALAGEARKIMKGFMKNLKGTLVGAMKEGGPVNALGVCKTKAASIAMQAAQESGWKVGRTSHRLRNKSNRPDEWERAVLQQFLARKEAGEDLKKVEHFEIVEQGGKKIFRYMKAIPVGKPCLNCHGSSLKPEVKAKLAELYPMDKATGFKLGDLRGAFTLSREIK